MPTPSLLGFVAVAAGAFGAHALRARLTPGDLEIFETMVGTSGSAGAQLMFHAMSRLSQTLLQRIPMLLFVHPEYMTDMPAVVEAIAAHEPDIAASRLEELFEKTDAVLVDRIALLP